MTPDQKRRRFWYLVAVLVSLIGIAMGVVLLMKSGIEAGLPPRPVFEDEQESGHAHGHSRGDAESHEGHDHD